MSTERNDSEKYFEWWLNELLDHGYIYGYNREPETFQLFPNYVGQRVKYFKTKEPELETFNFEQKREYNYDYNILWTPKSQNIFFQHVEFEQGTVPTFSYSKVYFIAHWNEERKAHMSYVDVKPPQVGRNAVQNSSYHTFPLKRLILLWTQGIYINKVVPVPRQGTGRMISLFPNTFTPTRYLATDGGQKMRKIRFVITKLNDYVKQRQAHIDKINSDLEKIYEKEMRQGEQQSLL